MIKTTNIYINININWNSKIFFSEEQNSYLSVSKLLKDYDVDIIQLKNTSVTKISPKTLNLCHSLDEIQSTLKFKPQFILIVNYFI